MRPPKPDNTRLNRLATWRIVGAAVFLGAAIITVYHRAFAAPFVFDDLPAILNSNPSIRSLWPPWGPLFPPHEHGQTVGGRPIPNYTLALNYALSGIRPWSYHAVNLLIHWLGALTLFGVVRRTLSGRWPAPAATIAMRQRFAARAFPLALGAALLWALHPVQTEAVTYVVQRVESLMALFYLLTIYCFIRSLDATRPARWRWAAVAACLLGMGSKEVMATAPLLVLLYDRLFVAGSWNAAWRARRGFYIGLASTWVLLAALVVSAEGRGGTAGFASSASGTAHLLTQAYAVPHYLRLAVWPSRLVFDYGFYIVDNAVAVLPGALVTLGLLAITIYGVVRGRPWSMLGAWFFVILAPTTLVPIPVQTMAEHRMYLPLAAVAVAVVLALYTWSPRLSFGVALLVAAVLGWATNARNADYLSPMSLWASVVKNHPGGSARADFNYADLLAAAGRRDEAAEQLQAALRIEPRFSAAYDNLGSLWLNAAQPERALRSYRRAAELDPTAQQPLFHAGLLLEQLGRAGEAIEVLTKLLALAPDRADAHLELGNALFRAGHTAEALTQYETAEGEAAISAEAASNIGTIWFDRGDFSKAVRYYKDALRLGPDSLETRVNLGNALALSGQLADAAREYQAALRLDPNDAQARENLGKVLARLSPQRALRP